MKYGFATEARWILSFRYRSRPLQQLETIVTDLTSGNRFLHKKEEHRKKTNKYFPSVSPILNGFGFPKNVHVNRVAFFGFQWNNKLTNFKSNMRLINLKDFFCFAHFEWVYFHNLYPKNKVAFFVFQYNSKLTNLKSIGLYHQLKHFSTSPIWMGLISPKFILKIGSPSLFSNKTIIWIRFNESNARHNINLLLPKFPNIERSASWFLRSFTKLLPATTPVNVDWRATSKTLLVSYAGVLQ